MTHHRQARQHQVAMRRAFAAFYADSFEYSEQHMAFLRVRRDNFLKTLR